MTHAHVGAGKNIRNVVCKRHRNVCLLIWCLSLPEFCHFMSKIGCWFGGGAAERHTHDMLIVPS